MPTDCWPSWLQSALRRPALELLTPHVCCDLRLSSRRFLYFLIERAQLVGVPDTAGSLAVLATAVQAAASDVATIVQLITRLAQAPARLLQAALLDQPPTQRPSACLQQVLVTAALQTQPTAAATSYLAAKVFVVRAASTGSVFWQPVVSGGSGASFLIPTASLAALRGTSLLPLIVTMAAYADHAMFPHNSSQQQLDDGSSLVVSVTVSLGAARLTVAGLPSPVVFSLPRPAGIQYPLCAWLDYEVKPMTVWAKGDQAGGVWSSKGCRSTASATAVECQCDVR